MIITDSLPGSPVKSTPTGSDAPTSITPLLPPPPPPYGASGSESRPIPTTEPAGKRFLKAFGIALLIYLAAGSLFGSVVISDGRARVIYGPLPEPSTSDGQVVACHLPFDPVIKSPDYGFPWPPANDSSEAPLDIPQGGGAAGLYPPLESRTAFQLHGSAPVLFFIAKGALNRGHITFKIAERTAPPGPDLISGEIITRYASVQARNRANICTLKRDEGSLGLGIYTPRARHYREEDILHFEVTITIPAHQAPLLAKRGLETDMPLFAHDFADLGEYTYYRSVKVKTSNMPVRATSLRAQSISIITKNAPILGFFHFSNSLKLETSNNAIKVDIVADNEDWHTPAEIDMTTTNGLLEAEVTLTSTTLEQRSSEVGLNIDADSTNGRVNLTIPSAPIDSHLNVDSKTTNADSYIGLPPTFEGLISMRGSGTMLLKNDETPDPTGRGQKRTLTIDKKVKDALQGRAWWGPEKDHRELSSAKAVTTNGVNIVELL